MYAQGCIDSRDGNDELRKSSLGLRCRRRSYFWCCRAIGLLYRRRPRLAGDVLGGSLPLNGLGFCARHGLGFLYVPFAREQIYDGNEDKEEEEKSLCAGFRNAPQTDQKVKWRNREGWRVS